MVDYYLFDATIFNLIFNNNNISHFYSTVSLTRVSTLHFTRSKTGMGVVCENRFPWQANDNYWSVCCQLQNCAAYCFVKKNQN